MLNRILERSLAAENEMWRKEIKKNYNLFIEHHTEWPSYTVQMLPTKKASRFKVALGTYTTEQEENHVKIIGLYANKDACVIRKSYVHEGDVNRLRVMPQDPMILASKSQRGVVYVYNTSYTEEAQRFTQLKLLGCTDEGYALAWSKSVRGLLASGGTDNTIALWNVESNRRTDVMRASGRLETSSSINDIDFHSRVERILSTVSDDGKLTFFDPKDGLLVSSVQVRDHEINCVSFNCQNDYYVATGSSYGFVDLYDIRKLDEKVHVIQCHSRSILQLEWSPHVEGLFATTSEDRKVNIYDASKIGNAHAPEEEPPELVFVHRGHCSYVTDLCWSSHQPGVIATVSDDNSLQLWQPRVLCY